MTVGIPGGRIKMFVPIVGMLIFTTLPGARPKPQHREVKCGPPRYCARTDLNLEPLPSKTPEIGPAGSIIRDPNFGSRILRVTDANSAPGHPNLPFATSSSAAQNSWNTDSTRFYVITLAGRGVLFNFDPGKMAAKVIGSTPPGWRDEPEFSLARPDIIYGWTADIHPKMQQYDIARGRTVDIFDPASCVELESDFHGRDVSVSTSDNRLMGVLGRGQDRDIYVVVHDRKQGCRWYNTYSGEIGGAWGIKGAAPVGSGFMIHNGRISRSGDYVAITAGTLTKRGLLIWEVGTTKVTLCTASQPYYCGGHWVMGFSNLINQPGVIDDMNLAIRNFKDLTTVSPLIKSLPNPAEWGFDSHWSWNDDDATDRAPVCGSTYSGRAAPNQVTRAWDNEIICVQTDGKESTVWRFAHHFSTARNGFWSTPRGNVSQDGKFYMFTSDWQNSLGPASNRGAYRVDVFIVELK